MESVLTREIAQFMQRARALGATPVMKLFMIPGSELRRIRCEACGRVMQVNLRGASRPVCWHPDCPSVSAFKGEPSCLYHVFARPPEGGHGG